VTRRIQKGVTRTPYVPSDLNNDLKVDAKDLLRMLSVWHTEVQNASPEDMNDDHVLDLMDLSLLQQEWHEASGP
jgi:hypothetical protein